LTAVLLFLLAGCSGAVSPSAVNSNSYVISGSITPASDGSGATLTLGGTSTATTTANSAGSYSFSNLTDGTYVVTPSRAGYLFSPSVQSVTINGADATGIDFSATLQASHSVSLSWQNSTSIVIGYNIYRGTSNGGPYIKINSSPITTLSYTDSSVTSGDTYYYVSTAVDSAGVESVYSNQVTATIP
jgi:hypothetical protein